jgi:iron complex transport system substrate-binding protein
MKAARNIAIMLAVALMFTLGACSGEKPAAVSADRQGNAITVPEKIERVISLGASNNEILAGLGLTDLVVGADEYSFDVVGIAPELCTISMYTPDTEAMMQLEPDLILVAGLLQASGTDPFKAFTDAGVCVAYVPSSDSFQSVMDDITFIGGLFGVQDKALELNADIQKEIDAVKTVSKDITDAKSVYFEINAAPSMYSFGSGTFLNEMIELIGAKNALTGIEGWITVTDEQVVMADPDVIITNVNYIDDPVGEINARPGWDAMKAVSSGAVYQVDTNATSRPSQNAVKGLRMLAELVYPEYFVN